MPINYKNYPKDWFTCIRPAILERANNRCEKCGVVNYSIGYRNDQGEFRQVEGMEAEAAWLDGEKLLKIVLTIAHLDNDIQNNEYSNLQALCQKCHLNLDKDYHAANRKQTRKKKLGLIDLFI